ncbi:DUF4012 domain-containing protein [Patescibacteria group bacterium]|nr:DUF4012 domain-containing protein [Patescibacteria group bacterium]
MNKSIIKKTSILLSRNTPVALVIGAGSFIGSNLSDKLLGKGIQVVGLDDLENGEKRNLRRAAENKNFHLVIESPDEVDLDLPRLDYLFIFPSHKWNIQKTLELFKKTKCRCLLVSSISFYEKKRDADPETKLLEGLETKIARYAGEHNLNARILRLGSVYGPRMNFKSKDPLIKLIQQSLTGDLQKQVSLEFSSRALYISDAVDLIIKTIFSGATSQRIFDGVLPVPIKVSEAKQILLDPIWHESRNFLPSELPPWPTPNLKKTVKILSWKPEAKLVTSLKQTLSYFRENEIQVPELDKGKESVNKMIDEGWKKEKAKELESFKGLEGDTKEKVKAEKRKILPKFSFLLSKICPFLVFVLVIYALVWPGLIFGWGIFTFNTQLNEGFKNLQKEDFEKSLMNIKAASSGIEEAESIFDNLEPIKRIGWFDKEFTIGENLFDLSFLSVDAAKNTILGTQSLLRSLEAVTGERKESPSKYFGSAQIELDLAAKDFSKASALLKNEDFKATLSKFFSPQIKSLTEKITLYTNLVNKAQAMSILLPKMVALDGSKTYLVLLQNNMELRPGGGFIGSFAEVSFEGGKLRSLNVNDVYAIDGLLSIHVEPPKEIKEDLGQKDWFLRDSNWEPDFPTSARQAEWFYTKETGKRVEGVIALDVSAINELLDVVGPLDLPDYSEKITADNLFERAIVHSELSFFPGSQAKKSFITALTNQLFNKIFFLPQNDWPGIISSLSKSLDEKHISIYLNDTKLFSYLAAQKWIHDLPRQSTQNQDQDFLSVVEANLGANKVNYYLDKYYNLETVVGKEGEIQHRLRINYINRSPSDVFPGGKYKNRLRIYLPFGSKISRVLWGEGDITKDVTSFVDYGRSGYSMLLELFPKEQKTLVLDYLVPIELEFKDGKANYRLDVIKQAGTLEDPFTWTVTYPISYKLVSEQIKKIGPQEHTISTDLSVDRSFEVEFKK